MRTTLLTLGLLLGPALASAADGVIEINQTRALAGGITPGDGAGFPVVLALPGSYRLTSNLQVLDENTTAIRVTRENVTIDLNGFVIQGPVTCAGRPIVCTPATGTGRGILASDVTLDNVAVHGGVVVGMGAAGVSLLGTSARIEALRVLGNAGGGIQTGADARVQGCVVGRNGGAGIAVGGSSLVAENVVTRNRAAGIQLNGSGTTVLHNSVAENDTEGIASGAGHDALLVRGNAVFDSTSIGIAIQGNGASIVDNALESNGTGFFLQPGILCGAGCNVDGNFVTLGPSWGLELGNNSAYRNNALIDNGAPVTGTGIERGGNFCTTAGVVAVCP